MHVSWYHQRRKEHQTPPDVNWLADSKWFGIKVELMHSISDFNLIALSPRPTKEKSMRVQRIKSVESFHIGTQNQFLRISRTKKGGKKKANSSPQKLCLFNVHHFFLQHVAWVASTLASGSNRYPLWYSSPVFLPSLLIRKETWVYHWTRFFTLTTTNKNHQNESLSLLDWIEIVFSSLKRKEKIKSQSAWLPHRFWNLIN